MEVLNNNEPVSEVIPKINRATNNVPVVTLVNATTPEIQKWGKQKKKNAVDLIEKNAIEQASIIEDDLDDREPLVVEDTKLGVDINDDSESETARPHELESDLGPYWTLAQSCQAYVLSTITSYSNIEASKSNPQYGFN
jgi:hypothetical protein